MAVYNLLSIFLFQNHLSRKPGEEDVARCASLVCRVVNHLAGYLRGEAWHGAGRHFKVFALKHLACKPEEGGRLWCTSDFTV